MGYTQPSERIPGVDLPVQIIESTRRKKTVSAKVVGGVLEVRTPMGLHRAERDAHIRQLATRLARKRASTELDLPARAAMLAKKYGLPRPNSIEWSSRQNSRWGSCTPSQGSVRISDRMSGMPKWVVDYVIIHELAHLVHLHHDADFHALVARYPRAERAEGFLEAVSLGFTDGVPRSLDNDHTQNEGSRS